MQRDVPAVVRSHLEQTSWRKELRTALTKYDASVAALARAASVPYQSFNNFMKATGEFGGRDNQGEHAAPLLALLLLLPPPHLPFAQKPERPPL